MINVDFYAFSKRKNSTAIPTGAGYTVPVLLKDSCSQESPVLQIHSASFSTFANYNYCYISFFSRYYFITSKEVHTGSEIWFYLEEDYLGSFKGNITAMTNVYVEYGSVASAVNVDRRIPTSAATQLASSTAVFPHTNFMSDGCAILSSVGNKNTGIYIFGGASQIYPLFDGIDWSSLTPPAGADAASAIVSMAQGLFDATEQFFVKDAASKNLRACFSLPWIPQAEAIGAAVSDLVVGSFPTGVSCHRIAKEIVKDSVQLTIPWIYSDWRRSANYCKVIVYLPLFGLVSMPVNSIRSESTLTVTYAFCYSNGDLSFEIKGTSSGDVFASGSVNCASPLAIGASNINLGKAAVSAIGASVGVGMAAMAMLPEAGAAISAAGVFGGIGGVTAGVGGMIGSAMGEPTGQSGGLGGYSGAELERDLHCYVVSATLTTEPATMAAGYNYPVDSVRGLAGLSGYTKLRSATFASNGTQKENDYVTSYINQGFYIE